MSFGPQLPPMVDGFWVKHITQVIFVVYGVQVMQKEFFLESEMYVTVTDIWASGCTVNPHFFFN